ncbi:MAG: hypothetical protein AAGA21_16070 [Pseudomonadota bacterium]
MPVCFYSWQSDLPNNINRGSIESCLRKALKAVNSDIKISDAIKFEQGIEGLPGSPDVAKEIFERVDACDIFVADISIVTAAEAPRPMPNANVMIEYGRRTKTCDGRQIVQVFNTAFGDWERDRPFDTRHIRKPLTYWLPIDHDEKMRRREPALETI